MDAARNATRSPSISKVAEPSLAQRFIDACQVLVGSDLRPGEGARVVAQMFEAMPHEGSDRDRHIADAVALRILLRWRVDARRPEDDKAFIEAVRSLLKGAAPALGPQTPLDARHRLMVRRVDVALALIRKSFGDSNFNLRNAAVRLSVSPWYLTKTLKRMTGHGFQWHLHDVRMGEARSLLRTTQLSIKEITGAVGYRYASDFDRLFKSANAMTPCGYRALTCSEPAADASFGNVTSDLWRRR
jgi:AraC-like DNA-binding protein